MFTNGPLCETQVRGDWQKCPNSALCSKEKVVWCTQLNLDNLGDHQLIQRLVLVSPSKSLSWQLVLSRGETERIPQTNGFHWERPLKPPPGASGSSQRSQHIMKVMPWLRNDSLPGAWCCKNTASQCVPTSVSGTSPAVQRLRLHSQSRGPGFDPWSGN